MSKKIDKGYTIFQKIYFTYFIIGMIIVIISGVITYSSRKNFIKKNVQSQGDQLLKSAINYFGKVYNEQAISDLRLMANSPSLDELLTAQKNQIYITRPNVEKLFLHYTKSYPDKYLSVRFVNAKGDEMVIAQGNKRLREYRNMAEVQQDYLYSQIKDIYVKLKDQSKDTVLFSLPFDAGNRPTVLVGIPKLDPEFSGFGGVIIIHMDLSSFMDYVSKISFNNLSIMKVYSPDDFNTYVLESDPDDYDYWNAMFIQSGTAEEILYGIKVEIPRFAYQEELSKAFWAAALLVLIMMGLVIVCAYFLSKKFSRPIELLLQGTKQIIGGDLTTKIPVTSSDEIGLLTSYFNKMVVNLKKSTDRLSYEAFHDVLTDLPNRTLLLDRLEMLINRYRRDRTSIFALLFIDLNRFKQVNDSMGHHTGDTLLKQISRRFKNVVRIVDTIGRLGGDEFVILMDQISSAKDPQLLADRLQKDLEKPFILAGQEIYVTCSIGIILSQEGYNQPADYLRDADTAMYYAKSSNTAHYKIFDESMRSTVVSTMQLEMDLRTALDQEQFVVHYQPIVCMKEKRIVRFEALIRWKHPERGFVFPDEFITNAEETGMIVSIDKWVLKRVCQDINEWNKRGLPEVQFSVNFSAKQFEQKGLLKQVKEILSEYKVPPQLVGIEITETVAMSDVSLSIAVLNELHELGITISIDDFGMGYSSLNSLKLFPVDHLKIDRHFINDLNSEDREAIIEAIIVMAHKLGYKVVAEGIETRKQMSFLASHKCDQGQGYYFSKPNEFEYVAELVNKPIKGKTYKSNGG